MRATNQSTDSAYKPLASGYRGLFYITHVNNLCSILRRGVLCYKRITKEQIQFTPVYGEMIVAGRRDRKAPNGNSLWAFANLYFQPRNAMLYRVLLEKSSEEIAILCIKPEILNRKDIYITVGGVGSERSPIVSRNAGRGMAQLVIALLCWQHLPSEDIPHHNEFYYVGRWFRGINVTELSRRKGSNDEKLFNEAVSVNKASDEEN